MVTRTFFPMTYRNAARSWDPFRQLTQLHDEMDRLFTTSYPRSTEYPPLNVWSNENETVVEAELPGFAADDIDISVVQNTLTLRGTRKPEELKAGESYHRRERRNGSFVRTLELPFEVDNKSVAAEYTAGILKVRLPRAEEHKPKKITVKAS